jgi:hypothetical protein
MKRIVNAVRRSEHVLNCRTFQCRSASDVEKVIAIFQAAFPVAFGNVQRNRLSGAKLLITGMAMKVVERSRDFER